MGIPLVKFITLVLTCDEMPTLTDSYCHSWRHFRFEFHRNILCNDCHCGFIIW